MYEYEREWIEEPQPIHPALLFDITMTTYNDPLYGYYIPQSLDPPQVQGILPPLSSPPTPLRPPFTLLHDPRGENDEKNEEDDDNYRGVQRD